MATERIHSPEDGFEEALARIVDGLVVKMNRPATAGAIDKALFGDVDYLNKSYLLGKTEDQSLS